MSLHIYIYIHIHILPTLGLRQFASKQYLPWGLKYINRSYFDLFGAPGLGRLVLRVLLDAAVLALRVTGFFG